MSKSLKSLNRFRGMDVVQQALPRVKCFGASFSSIFIAMISGVSISISFRFHSALNSRSAAAVSSILSSTLRVEATMVRNSAIGFLMIWYCSGVTSAYCGSISRPRPRTYPLQKGVIGRTSIYDKVLVFSRSSISMLALNEPSTFSAVRLKQNM